MKTLIKTGKETGLLDGVKFNAINRHASRMAAVWPVVGALPTDFDTLGCGNYETDSHLFVLDDVLYQQGSDGHTIAETQYIGTSGRFPYQVTFVAEGGDALVLRRYTHFDRVLGHGVPDGDWAVIRRDGRSIKIPAKWGQSGAKVRQSFTADKLTSDAPFTVNDLPASRTAEGYAISLKRFEEEIKVTATTAPVYAQERRGNRQMQVAESGKSWLVKVDYRHGSTRRGGGAAYDYSRILLV